MNNAKFITAADAMDTWQERILTGEPPKFFPIAESGPLSKIEIGPKQITLFGGAPGAGKTAFVMQAVVDALRLSPKLRAVVCNIEMPPEVLLDRQLARLTGIPLNAIRYRNLNEQHGERLSTGFATIEEFADRLCFVRPPFNLANVAATADAFMPSDETDLLLVLDYIQRIAPPGGHGDKRGSIDASMSHLRNFADDGAAVVVVSSVGRQKDSRGRTSYGGDNLNLASFKESGELEFGADDAYILTPTAKGGARRQLKHLKARHTQPTDVDLLFHGSTQSFTACVPPGADATSQQGDLQEALVNAWGATSVPGVGGTL